MVAYNSLMKNVLTSLVGNAESFLLNFLMYLQIASTDVCDGYPKLQKSSFGLWSDRQTMF